MGWDYKELKQLDHTHLWHPFAQMQEWMREELLIIERGEGSYLVDIHGRKYIDGVSSLWCNLYGHQRPELDEAIRNQLDRIAHTTFLGLSHVPGIKLAQKLTEIAPPGLQRVFYSDSGSTAVEVALKMAFQYWQLKGEKNRTRFASLVEAYHGDTVGAMSVGYSEVFHRFHRPLLFPALRISPPHVFRCLHKMSEQDALKAAIEEAEEQLSKERDSLAAFVMEPLMQGAAGMWSQPPGYVKSLSEICRRNRILLILDEVATGFGRTGRMFACEHEDVSPDLLCLGKGMTAGYLPLAATLATEEIFGPVLSVMKVRTFDEALALANSTGYKLTGGVYSRKPSNIERARAEFRVGNLYINRGCTGALVGRQPFGGFGLSGVGTKAGGPDYLLHFVEPRSICENTMRRGFAPGL